MPKNAYPALGNLTLTMSGGPLAFSKVQSEALEGYAHKSTYLLAAQLLAGLSSDDLASIQNLVSTLLKSADENGAYRFWSEPVASPTLSALALLAYSEASLKDIHIDSIQLNRTIAYLWKSLKIGNLSSDDAVFILWALGKNEQYDTKMALTYFQEREYIGIKGQAFLLMNLDQLIQAGQGSMSTPFSTLKAEIIDEAIQEEELVYFDAPNETTAIVLYALSKLGSANPLLEKMANYLVFQEDDLIREFNPAEALWTILAIRSYTDQSDTSGTNYIAQVKLNGTIIVDQSVTGKSADEVYQTKVEAKMFNASNINDIFVKKDGTGPLYLDAHLNAYLDPTQVLRTEDGMIIVRKLYEITDEGERIPASTFKKGVNYVSELEVVVPKDTVYVTLTDSIPAGMKTKPGMMELSEPFSQSHLESGQITYYASHLPAGVYKISTELQAVLAGTYLHLPASIQAMFSPATMSRTEGGIVQIID